MASIHPTAIVEPGAQLGANVTIGAYAFVGADVTLGAGCVLHHHASVEGFTQLGPDCEVFPYAVIGGRTQDLKARPGKPGLKVGARNVFREYVSVHLGTQEGEWTLLGDDNTLLAYSHIAH
ncbi:acyl-[acyl-carrier-protein]--UDP-N-acetylglucosamine O-acyltransferase, partial [bacterium]|nr:acyl-[acyl-carrier-protein]--UDP-N-acetylglucosamine O-acyltransferase [bacterium]